MKKIFMLVAICVSLCYVVNTNAASSCLDLNIRIMQAKCGREYVDFIKADTCLDVKKPVILFLQGSRSFPLIFTESKVGFYDVLFWQYFNYRQLSEKYHLVMLANPGTPVSAEFSELNEEMNYITNKEDPYSYPEEYQKNNNLSFFTNRANEFIKYLKKQKWVDASQIYLLGHSQGTYIAVEVAKRNKNIAGIGFFGGSPLGRQSEYIMDVRKDENGGKYTHSEAQEEIDKIYKWYQKQCDNIKFEPNDGSDSPKTTISFSVMQILDIANLKVPVYVAFGTMDSGAVFCDYLPIAFMNSGKKDWKVRAYPGYEHNFFETDTNGNPDLNKPHWNEVMTDFVDWIDSLKTLK